MLTPGKAYVLGGHGDVFLEAVEESGTVGVFLDHGNYRFWAYVKRVLRPLTVAGHNARQAQARARGVDCNTKDCWCRLPAVFTEKDHE